MKKVVSLLILCVGMLDFPVCYTLSSIAIAGEMVDRKGQFYLTYDSKHKLHIKFNSDLRKSKIEYLKLSTNPQLGEILNRYDAQLQELINLSDERINNIEKKVKYFQKKYSQQNKSILFSYDLRSYMQVNMPNSSNENLFNLAREIEQLDIVEYVELIPENMPPPNEIPVTSEAVSNDSVKYDYENMQNYLGPDPGVNIHYAWSRGITGSGVTLVDLEYDWNFQHESFKGLNVGYGGELSPIPFSFKDHGTAVAGMIYAQNNGEGVTGGMYNLEGFIGIPEFSHEQGHNRSLAFSKAIEVLSPGDVIIIEMQTIGPGSDVHYVPAEYEQSVWDMTRMATDMGIIVIAAGGNGNQNIDDAKFATYRKRGDSGAIIVGAGSADKTHRKLWYSTYGSQFHLQAWGENIITAGYGDLYDEEINRNYTASFGGTSGAVSIVALVAIAILSHAETNYGVILSPAETREILVSTAIDCSDCALIGKIPDTKTAILEVDQRYSPKINENPVNACINHCGKQAQSGCWCDTACVNYDDCCSDYNSSCVTVSGGNSDSCAGNCEGYAGNCWCDYLCSDYQDCCIDFELICSDI